MRPAGTGPTGTGPDIAGLLTETARSAPVRARVRGACMRPILDDGDTVEIRAARVYWPGDLVAFASRQGDLVVHRLVGYRWRSGAPWAITMADAAARTDSSIPFDRVIGRVVGAAPARPGLAPTFGDRCRALARFAAAALALLGSRRGR